MREMENIDIDLDLEMKNKFIIFKRCGKASDIVKLPEKSAKISLTNIKTNLDIRAGDIVNTKKDNQLFILLSSDVDVSYMFDLEKSTFEPSYILARNTFKDQGCVKLSQVKMNGKEVYIINKRVVSFADIVDSAVVFMGEEAKQMISRNKKGELFLPGSIYSLIGAVKESLFASVIE